MKKTIELLRCDNMSYAHIAMKATRNKLNKEIIKDINTFYNRTEIYSKNALNEDEYLFLKQFNTEKEKLLEIMQVHKSLMEAIKIDFVILDVSANSRNDLRTYRVGTSFYSSSSRLNKGQEFTIENLSEYYKPYFADIKVVYTKNDNDNDLTNDVLSGTFPAALKCQFYISCNLRSLEHIYSQRLCIRAREEIRLHLTELKKQIIELYPEYERFLVPKCEQLLYCDELQSCGKVIAKAAVKKMLNK